MLELHMQNRIRIGLKRCQQSKKNHCLYLPLLKFPPLCISKLSTSTYSSASVLEVLFKYVVHNGLRTQCYYAFANVLNKLNLSANAWKVDMNSRPMQTHLKGCKASKLDLCFQQDCVKFVPVLEELVSISGLLVMLLYLFVLVVYLCREKM